MKLSFFGLLVISASVYAGTGDFRDPSAASGTNWTNPTYVFAGDGLLATYSATSKDNLFVMDFAVGAVYPGTIDSIVVRISGYAVSGNPNKRQIDVALTKDGLGEIGDVVTVVLTKDPPPTELIVRGSTDDLWGTTWTPAEINATTFGVTLSNNNTSSDSLKIDHVQIAVWWTATSVVLSNSTFTFGTQPLNTWLNPDSSFIINDGTVLETFKGKISQFTDGTNMWEVDNLMNGADTIRARWSILSATGPWNAISAYDSDFTIATGVAVGDSVVFWFQIETPISTSSNSQYSSTLTITAE